MSCLPERVCNSVIGEVLYHNLIVPMELCGYLQCYKTKPVVMFLTVRLTPFLFSINLSEVCYFCNITLSFWNTPFRSSKKVRRAGTNKDSSAFGLC